MTTFTVAASTTYTGTPADVTLVDYTNTPGPANATFQGSQFDGILIRNDVTFDGNAAGNHITVNNVTLLDASGWQFTHWNNSVDTIFLNAGSGNDTIIGSIRPDHINAGSGTNFVTGGGGADTLNGGSDNDFFVYDHANEFVAGETVKGADGTDSIRLNIAGGSINFTTGALTSIEQLIFDSAGTATLAGNSFGNAAGLINTVTGSAGSDTVAVVGASIDLTNVAFNGWTGLDQIQLSGTAGNDVLIGSGLADRFGGDLLGTDSWSGGGGDDRFIVNNVSAGTSINGGGGLADVLEVFTAIDLTQFALFAGIEHLSFSTNGPVTAAGSSFGAGAITEVLQAGVNGAKLIVNGASVNLSGVTFTNWNPFSCTITINGTGGNDTLIGSVKDETITGGAGADAINGVGGTDILEGGDGNDTYTLEALGDTITENAGAAAGTADLVVFNGTSGTFVLTSLNLENLTLGGVSAINGTGNSGNNVLKGNSAANVLDGGAGNDTYALGAEASGVDTVTDSTGTDTITSTINRNLASFAAIENLTLIGTAVAGTGNGLINTVTGNAAANVLTAAGAGNVDTLRGLDGNDTYVIDSSIDTVQEAAGAAAGASDVVQWTGTAGQSYTLAANVEKLTLMGAAATNATGNAVVNTITGNAAVNTLTAAGAGNVDTLKGLSGNDIYVIDSTIDTVVEAAGGGTADHVKWTGTAGQIYTLAAEAELLTLTGAAATNGNGNALVNTITGNGAANVLKGGAGADILLGGTGTDTLLGQAGNDTFRFIQSGDSAVGGSRDVVQDFDDGGDNDVIDFSEMASVTTFIGAAAFTAAGQVRAVQSGVNVLVQINTVGAGGAESEILIANATLGAGAGQVDGADFLL